MHRAIDHVLGLRNYTVAADDGEQSHNKQSVHVALAHLTKRLARRRDQIDYLHISLRQEEHV